MKQLEYVPQSFPMPEVTSSNDANHHPAKSRSTCLLCVFALSCAQLQTLISYDVQLLDPTPMSPSLFTHNFVPKLSLGRPVASQRAVSSSQSSYSLPAPYTHPFQHSCKRAAAGGRYMKRSCHGGCWMTIRILWCRRGRCLCSGIGAARVVAGCGVCLP